MVKMFCDRCGKEISEDHEYYKNCKYDIEMISREEETDKYVGHPRKPIHLCLHCEIAFEHFLEGSDNK